MTDPHDDWSDLSKAWTEPTPQDAEAARADAAFIRSLHRRDRLARINYAAEMLGGVAVLAVVVWVALRNDLPWPVVAAALGFVALGMAATVWSRRGDPGVLTGTPQDVLRSAVAQARTGERWGWAGVGISLAAGIFLFVVSRYDPGGLESDAIYPIFSVFLLACIVGYLIHARRCRQRRRAHQATLDALGVEPTDASL
ncbi:hypothetical protein [Brevundimonas sp.]